MIFNAALSLIVGTIIAALTVAARLGPLSAPLVMGCTLTAFAVLEAVRKANSHV